MKKTLIASFSFLVFIFCLHFFSIQPVLASVRCENQYGGGQICTRTGEVQVDKKVWNAQVNSFVDNMGTSDHIFVSGEEVVFKIKVKNVGDETLSTVNVWDTLPSYLYLSGGSLNYTIYNLTPGAVDEREIRARVVSKTQLPTNSCFVNTAGASSNNSSDKDTAQVCIQTRIVKVTPVKHIPKTGPEMVFLGALPAIGAMGVYIKLKAKKRI